MRERVEMAVGKEMKTAKCGQLSGSSLLILEVWCCWDCDWCVGQRLCWVAATQLVLFVSHLEELEEEEGEERWLRRWEG